MSQPLTAVSDHLRAHFATMGIDGVPDVASVTFLGVERIDVLRFGPDHRDGLETVYHYVSLGCSRYPMSDGAAVVSDPVRGPRAEIALSLRVGAPADGLARSIAVVAATPAVEGVVLGAGALVDLSGPLWTAAPFTAVLLGTSEIPDLALSRRGIRCGSYRRCRSPRLRGRGCDSKEPRRCVRRGVTIGWTFLIRCGGRCREASC